MTKTAVKEKHSGRKPEEIRRGLQELINDMKNAARHLPQAQKAYITLCLTEKLLTRCLSVSRETLLNLELLQANDNGQLWDNLFKLHEDLLTAAIASPSDIKNKNMK